LLNERTGQALVIKTSSNGCFKTPVKKGISYTVKAMQANYIADCYSFGFDSLNQVNDLTFPRELLLEKLQVNRVFTLENIYYDLINPSSAGCTSVSRQLVRILKENP